MTRMILFTVFTYMLMFFVTCRGCKRIAKIIDDIDGLYKSFPQKFTVVKYNNIIRCIFNIKTKVFYKGYYGVIILLLIFSLLASIICVALCAIENFERVTIYMIFCDYYMFFFFFQGAMLMVVQLHSKRIKMK